MKSALAILPVTDLPSRLSRLPMMTGLILAACVAVVAAEDPKPAAPAAEKTEKSEKVEKAEKSDKAEKAKPAEAPKLELKANGDWLSLFDGKSLDGWKLTEFAGKGKVTVKDGELILGVGSDLTGVNLVAAPPTMDYEVELEAKRVSGSDFFCGLTFPFNDKCCTLVMGGWGGSVVGISSINGFDASENETTRSMEFAKNRWYHVRVRVTKNRIEAWVDQEKVANIDTTEKKISMRPGEIEDSAPFGIASWETAGALRDIRIRKATSTE